MKIKLDENIPLRLVSALENLGHDVDTVADEGLSGKPDEAVWHAAQQEKRFLITQDLDFSDTRRFQPGTHSGILLVRLHEPGANALFHQIVSAMTDIVGGLKDIPVELWQGSFIVLTENKLRIKHPFFEVNSEN
jgi:predicted nuclease of predicted toxin-antitoxin system